jgi:hypothetical protein
MGEEKTQPSLNLTREILGQAYSSLKAQAVHLNLSKAILSG